MGWNSSLIRKIDIFDKEVQKRLNITNLLEINNNPDGDEEADEDYWMYDLFAPKLYTFEMLGKKYTEYKKEIILSNGNSEEIIVGFYETSEKEPESEVVYQNQGGECPKCKAWHSKLQDGKQICLDCGYEGTEEEFSAVFMEQDED